MNEDARGIACAADIYEQAQRVIDESRFAIAGLEGQERRAAKNRMFGALYGSVRPGVKTAHLPAIKIEYVPKKETVMTKGIHRSTPNSKSGRRMISPGRDFYPHNVSKEHEEWNRQVELKKAAKKAANFQKRHGLTWADGTPCSPPPALQSAPTGVAVQLSEPQKDMVRALALTGGSIG